MQDYTFGLTPNLPPPDQSTANISGPGQPVGAAGTPTTTGSKNVGGSTSGIDASKGAITSIGANSLIVDQGVEGSIATEISSDTSLENPEHVFSTSQINFVDSQTQIETLGKEIDILNEIGPTFGLASLAVTSALKDTISSSSVAGKIKGDDGTKMEKGDRRDDAKKADGKRKGAEEAASPSGESSVSRAVSAATGATTTTITTSSSNSSGGVTTNTSTTVSAGSPPPSSDSSETSPPPSGGFSFTEIMAEIGELENQESTTMAQQQNAQIDAINLQAKDSIAGADKIMQGAAMMMTMATIGLATSMATSAYQIGGVGGASAEGDKAEMEGMDEGNQALTSASESSLHETELATSPEGLKSPEQYTKAQSSIKQMEVSTKAQAAKGTISKEQEESLNKQAAASKQALEQSKYLPGGSLNKDGSTTYESTKAHTQANKDADAVGKGPIGSPEDAVTFYNKQASDLAKGRPQGISYSQLSKAGIRPGQQVSDEDAAKIIGTDDPAKVKAFQDNVSKLTINRNSQTWQNAYSNHFQKIGIYAGTGQALTQVFNSAGSMEDQIAQAQQQKSQAAAQVEGSTEQAMAQGTQQTQSLADQFRQSQTAVAQDMSSMVSATRV